MNIPQLTRIIERFALQSIHSYITNYQEAGFGISYVGKNHVRVVAIATKLHSVMNTLLPPGYQFVMIDKTGKVWFHSTTDKNLNENFFDETGMNKKLIAAVAGRLSAWVPVNYDRANHQSFIKPIRNTELFLIVLHDDEHFNTPIVLTVGFAFIFVFLLLSVQGMHQLILIISTNRFSLLKIRRFFLTWLRPQIQKKEIYQDAVYVQLILFFMTAGIALFSHSLNLVVCFLALPVFLTMYHYFSVKRSYIIKDGKRQSRRIFTHPFFLASLLLVLFVNFSGMYFLNLGELMTPLLIQFVFVATLLIFYRIKDLDPAKDEELGERIGQVLRKKVQLKLSQSQLLTRFKPAQTELLNWLVRQRMVLSKKKWVEFVLGLWRKVKLGLAQLFAWIIWLYMASIRIIKGVNVRFNKYENAYMAYLFLWLILASIVPTYYFYKIGYYEEGKVWLRFEQLQAAQQQEHGKRPCKKNCLPLNLKNTSLKLKIRAIICRSQAR